MQTPIIAVLAFTLASSVTAKPLFDSSTNYQLSKAGDGGASGASKSGSVGDSTGGAVTDSSKQNTGTNKGGKVQGKGGAGGSGGNLGDVNNSGGTNTGPSIGAGANIQTGPVAGGVVYVQNPDTKQWLYGAPAPVSPPVPSNGITIGGAQNANGGTNDQRVKTKQNGGANTSKFIFYFYDLDAETRDLGKSGAQNSGGNKKVTKGAPVTGGQSGKSKTGAGGFAITGNKQKASNENANNLSAQVPVVPRALKDQLARRQYVRRILARAAAIADPDIYGCVAEPEEDDDSDVYERDPESLFGDDVFEGIYRRSGAYLEYVVGGSY